MSSKNLLALYGLKWNPFSPELPSECSWQRPRSSISPGVSNSWSRRGDSPWITGESGTGKSVALRIVAGRLSAVRDVTVGVIERPQSKSPDFYRELGDIFAVKLRRTIVGADSRRPASAGKRTWPPRESGPCS